MGCFECPNLSVLRKEWSFVLNATGKSNKKNLKNLSISQHRGLCEIKKWVI